MGGWSSDVGWEGEINTGSGIGSTNFDSRLGAILYSLGKHCCGSIFGEINHRLGLAIVVCCGSFECKVNHSNSLRLAVLVCIGKLVKCLSKHGLPQLLSWRAKEGVSVVCFRKRTNEGKGDGTIITPLLEDGMIRSVTVTFEDVFFFMGRSIFKTKKTLIKISKVVQHVVNVAMNKKCNAGRQGSG
jgi:hypothetical protein